MLQKSTHSRKGVVEICYNIIFAINALKLKIWSKEIEERTDMDKSLTQLNNGGGGGVIDSVSN